MEGGGHRAGYLVPAAADEPQVAGADTRTDTERGAAVPLSKRGIDIRAYLRQPPAARTPAGYRRGFLEAYRPNVSFHLSVTQRSHLGRVGRSTVTAEPAGTYARRILDRLLIDLSWNSSRLEGNTYSLLDTRRLIEFGQRRRSCASRSPDDPEPQGGDRVPGRRGGRHRFQPPYPPQSPCHPGQQPAAGRGGVGPAAADSRRHRAIGLPPAGGAPTHRGVFRSDPDHDRRHRRSVRAGVLHHGAPAVPAALRRRQQARLAPWPRTSRSSGTTCARCLSPTCRGPPTPRPCSACTS